MEYGTIQERAERVLIICTGPSLGNPRFPAASGRYTIAVNGAIDLPFIVDAFFTCDPSLRNRQRLRRRRPGVKYFAAVPDEFGTKNAKSIVHQHAPDYGVTWLRRLEGDGPWRHRLGLSEDPGCIHTGNSAYGALGMAYLMGARKIAFVGMDATQSPYACRLQGKPGDLSHLPDIFRTALPQLEAQGVQVRVGSPASRVDCFPRCNFGEALSWLMS